MGFIYTRNGFWQTVYKDKLYCFHHQFEKKLLLYISALNQPLPAGFWKGQNIHNDNLMLYFTA